MIFQGYIIFGAMRLLKNAAKHEILTPENELRDQLKRIEGAGRTCYQSCKGRITHGSAEKFIEMILKRGHLSVLEHSSLTVRFRNVSRGFTHELVRHRLAAYSQESTRYVDYAKRGDEVDLDKFRVSIVAPPHRDENEDIVLDDGREISFSKMGTEIERYYRGLRKAGWLPQDARQILPIGLRTEIVATANFREWLHIFALRTAPAAHWEIRAVMIELLKDLQKMLPPVFGIIRIKGKDRDGVPFAESKLVL